MKQIVRLIGIACIAALLAGIPAQAQRETRVKREPPAKKHASQVGIFGAVYGTFARGDMTLTGKSLGYSNATYRSSAGDAYGGHVDVPVYRLVWAGISMDRVEFPYFYTTTGGLDVSLHGKLQLLSKNGKLALRPSGAIGRGIASNIPGYDGQVNVMTGRYYLEGIWFFAKSFGLKVELGQYHIISGGARDFDITGGPFTYLRGGLVFGKLKKQT